VYIQEVGEFHDLQAHGRGRCKWHIYICITYLYLASTPEYIVYICMHVCTHENI